MKIHLRVFRKMWRRVCLSVYERWSNSKCKSLYDKLLNRYRPMCPAFLNVGNKMGGLCSMYEHSWFQNLFENCQLENRQTDQMSVTSFLSIWKVYDTAAWFRFLVLFGDITLKQAKTAYFQIITYSLFATFLYNKDQIWDLDVRII